jgi:hypothetical protein
VDVLLNDFGDPDIADRPAVLTASVAASSHEVLLVPMMSITLLSRSRRLLALSAAFPEALCGDHLHPCCAVP